MGCLKSTLKFINEDAASVHGAVRASSIFASESGEWKLGGFDVLSSMNDENAIIYVGHRRPLNVVSWEKQLWLTDTQHRHTVASSLTQLVIHPPRLSRVVGISSSAIL